MAKERRQQRSSFTEEFNAGAVRLVLDEGKTIGPPGGRARDVVRGGQVLLDRHVINPRKVALPATP